MELINYSWKFFQIGGPARDETDETHRRSNALIHGSEMGVNIAMDVAMTSMDEDPPRIRCTIYIQLAAAANGFIHLRLQPQPQPTDQYSSLTTMSTTLILPPYLHS